jgi:hypothetical protein
VEEKIYNILDGASTIPVLKTGTPDVIPCVTFHFFNENAPLMGGGNAAEEGASCQVDIWYKVKEDKVTSTVKAIHTALKAEKTFTYPIGDEIYGSENKVWHKYFTFELIKESEV